MNFIKSTGFAFLLIPVCLKVYSSDQVLNLYDELLSVQTEYKIPAISLAVIADANVVFTGGVGFLSQNPQKVTTSDTLFRVASISKLFTAQAIMQLVEKEVLNLDDPVSTYLPHFGDSGVSIRALLTHTSGIRDHIKPIAHSNNRPLVQYLEQVSDSLEGGGYQGRFNYSDTGFNVLGAVINKVSGMPFDHYIKTHILMPAKMSQSGYFNGELGVMPEALPIYQGRVIPKHQQRPYDPNFFPSEGLVSNVSDLANWLVFTLSFNKQILTEKSYKAMLKPSIMTTWGDIHIGLAWQVYFDNNQLVARHPGSIRGYKSLIIAYPRSKNALVLLTNSNETPRFEIAQRFVRKLKDLKIWK